MWVKYVTRRLAVQVAQAWNFGWGKAMQRTLGISVRNTLVFRDVRKTDYYVDQAQHKKYIAGLYKLLENEKFIKTFHKTAQKKLENILKNTKDKFDRDLSQLTNQELLQVYKDFILPNVEQFYIMMWTVFNIGEPLANVVRNNLKKYIKEEKEEEKVDKYLLSLSSPLVPNDVLNERIDLLKLALAKNEKDFLKKIKNHTRKYQHIPMFDFDHQPYSQKHFLKELKAIKNPNKELAELKKLFTNRQKEFKRIIKEIKPDQKFKNLLGFLKESVFLRDYRDMIRQKLNIELREFYAEAGKRLGLVVKEVAILTNDELIKYLKSNRKFSKSEVENREKAFLLIQKGDDVQIYSGGKALTKAKKELKIDKLKKVTEIRGVTGSEGRAIGIVKIVYTNKDLPKIKRGDILVAAMTRQDFVPAIRKAAAVVTDEGSVTCHAAIISRELRVPCIVATKIATRALKDGDKVEVDATKGVVRKL